MSLDQHLEAQLRRLEAEGLLRAPEDEPLPAGIVDACSNDYLGYSRRVVSRETVAPPGAGASRLIFGTRPEHRDLEREVAAWVGAASALLFASGYAANLGLIAALVAPGDLVVSDALNHASIVDGCRLARATVRVVPHLDVEAIAAALDGPTAGRRWVVTETYFSMDADSPDLGRLRELCDQRGAALLVDEAHAMGVLGPQGAGLCAASGVRPDAVLVGLGKAVGAQGALIAGSAALTRFLWNRARSFVFTTAPSPLLAAIACDHVRAARADDARRARLADLGALFEEALAPIRPLLPARRHGPIFPILLGSPDRARAVALALRECGFLVQAIRPPTVPSGTARLRIALRADMTSEDVLRLAAHVVEQCSA